ncbi:MAG: transporter [Flavobacteriaceae bacterium CG_4_8_14_3_um_filter_34_10]|nr:TolC family protein [Flavobacteriia bacterium]OIP51943.1 MAG: transporter [Flavobacteriaceae bacterium CG2_30_34_30]PIQ17389.1 MAG: transporter [Flavobacteriaceae bacterium CG18_big_fil_WC_8_21_14_2_50_34_36]PIV50382.1 MAG: transporter [Flavobacteriaceae bacterium CG02_land_8_20_14_3_00_34_13]PIX09911.1 MAG: transporter [Flavobacteriaceae bacterium CG_4_8_14_3_um_filter_34_10]PIZ08281.1 MAG: transporter [Flavobacteriaceae bacterium CG_4_10_14_0_8_um_filter_34_31]PJC08620.1 MAG: transporter
MRPKVLIILLFVYSLGFSQNIKTYTFSLKEAVTFALDSNYSVINAKRDVLKALKQKWETTATGLPQISAGVDYRNNLKQPVTLIPSEFSGGAPGTFTPVVFGVPQTMNASATINQLLFDGSYIVALQASKTFLEFSKNLEQKTTSDIRKEVVNAYGSVLLSRENLEILESNKATLEKNLKETTEIFKNGFVEEEDVEQLQITLTNIEIQLNNAKRVLELSSQLFHITLGIDLNASVTLTDNLDKLIAENIDLQILSEELTLENNIDYKIAYNFTEQRRLELKLEKYKALPTLSAFVNYGTQANSDTFTFFDTNQQWFQSSVAGVSLRVPIFSSLGRRAKTQRAEIAFDQAKTNFTEAIQQIKLQVKSAKNNYQFTIEKYENAKNNLALAKRIETKNQIKFFEGLSSSFELRQAQIQLYTAQQEYLQSMLDVITNKAELERILYTTTY